jgi:hypothetical protein
MARWQEQEDESMRNSSIVELAKRLVKKNEEARGSYLYP